MNYNSFYNKPTLNHKELIGDNKASDIGGMTEEDMQELLETDLTPYYSKDEIDDLFSRSFVYREKSGSIVTFDCPSTSQSIPSLTVGIEPVQAGNGDPSPTNIRPISGWSAVNVTDASENLFNGEYPYIDNTVRKITLDVGDGSFTMVSTIPVYVNAGQNIANIFLQTGTGEETASSDLDGVWKGHPITVNSIDGKVTIKYMIFNNIGVCDPRRYETWLARSITTYTTTLKDGQDNPLTCYGGQLVNENGVQTLANKNGYKTVGDLNWTYITSGQYPYFGAQINGMNRGSTDIIIKCSSYKPINGKTGGAFRDNDFDKCIANLTNTASVNIGIQDSSYNDADVFKTAMASVQIAYELTEPEVIPQDNLSIATQDGINNLWADSGDVDVECLDRIIPAGE